MSEPSLRARPALPIAEFRLAILIVIELMVDEPEAVEVAVEDRGDGRAFNVAVKVTEADKGKVIGLGGRTARSLRVLLSAVAKAHGVSINLDFVD